MPPQDRNKLLRREDTMGEMKRLMGAVIDRVLSACPSTLDTPAPHDWSDLVTVGDGLPVRVARVEIDDRADLVVSTGDVTGEPDVRVTVPLDGRFHDDLVVAALQERDKLWAEQVTDAADADLQGRVRGLPGVRVGVRVVVDDTVEDERVFLVTPYRDGFQFESTPLSLSGDADEDALTAADVAAEALGVGELLARRWDGLWGDDPDIESVGDCLEDGTSVSWYSVSGADTDSDDLYIGVFGSNAGERSVEWWQGDQWCDRLAEKFCDGPRETLLSLYFSLVGFARRATGEPLTGAGAYQGARGDGLPQRVRAAIMAVPEGARENCTLVVDTETGMVSIHGDR